MSIGHGSASDLSAGNSQEGSLISHASSLDDDHAEVLSKAPGMEGGGSVAAANGLNHCHSPAAASASAADVVAVDDPAASSGYDPDKPQVPQEQFQGTIGTTNVPVSLHPAVAQSLGTGLSLSHQPVSDMSHGRIVPSEAAPVSQVPHGQTDAAAAGNPVTIRSDSDAIAPTPVVSGEAVVLPGGGKASHRKRTAATVFDQGVAVEAEAADLHAGIVAGDADKPKASLDATEQADASQDAGTDAGTLSTVADNLSHGQDDSLLVKPRKLHARPAPWR